MKDFTPLVIIAFMVISALGRVLGKSRPAPPAPRRPRPTGAPSRPRPTGEGGSAEERPATTPARVERAPSADVLVPDDLWAILTGERRPPMAPPPAPEPAPAPWADDSSGDEAARRREVEVAERLAAEARERELDALIRRPSESPLVPVPAAGEEDEVRHQAFHQRLAATTPSAALQVETGRRPLSARQKQLRRAIILREVLGTPRGLEERG